MDEDERVSRFVCRCVAVLAAALYGKAQDEDSGLPSARIIRRARPIEGFLLELLPFGGEETT